jgi:hypothetical protein
VLSAAVVFLFPQMDFYYATQSEVPALFGPFYMTDLPGVDQTTPLYFWTPCPEFQSPVIVVAEVEL